MEYEEPGGNRDLEGNEELDKPVKAGLTLKPARDTRLCV